MKPVEHVEGGVTFERRDAHLLHNAAYAFERFGRRLNGRRDLGINRPEAGLHQPPNPQRSNRRGTAASIEPDGARREAIKSSGPTMSE